MVRWICDLFVDKSLFVKKHNNILKEIYNNVNSLKMEGGYLHKIFYLSISSYQIQNSLN